ncbi:MAG: ferrochelatase [Candidatus Nanopelagicaceae bacterium]|nr:ferrochelatase [Candidatus Nanopelagicaceae bacterium]
MSYDAILLTTFGGPESVEEVMPFLERVTAGRGVPRERLEEVSHHYLALGGVSPINEQSRNLLKCLREEFTRRGIETPVYWGNRNSHPFLTEALQKINADGHRRVLAFVSSAYASYSGCRQYRENLAQALIDTELNGILTVDKVRNYFDHPGFIAPFANGLTEALETLNKNGINAADTSIFFTTHSIPVSMAETSGPESIRNAFGNGAYVAQHNATATCIVEEVKKGFAGEMPAWSLVYQSRSGAPHLPWLEPDIGDALRTAAESGTSAVIVVPIGFISDHVEVIWDLDHEAKGIADELGLQYFRVATPGTSSEFVAGVVDLIQERQIQGEKKALSPIGPWPDFCASDCCPNPRKELPTVAQISN